MLVLAAPDSIPPRRSSRLFMASGSASPDRKREECDRGLAAEEPLLPLSAMVKNEMRRFEAEEI